MTRDPVETARVSTSTAIVYLWLGDREAAIRELQAVVKLPGGPSPGGLRLDPHWDELRSDPKFFVTRKKIFRRNRKRSHL